MTSLSKIAATLFVIGCIFCHPAAWAQLHDQNSTSLLEEVKPTSFDRPSIVFIFTDDLGYGDIGAFGANDVKTPHIDSLATNGAKFTQFYSASPVCSPSRAGLLTGRYPVRMGIHHVFHEKSYEGMPEAEITIAEQLKQSGYATSIVGKWHLGDHKRFLPLNQGFDEFFGIPYSNDMLPLPMMRGNDYIEATIDQTQLTKRLTQEAVSFIDRKADTPFFLYLAHPMPHVPIFRSEEFENVSERGAYGDAIQELDWSTGEILAALKRNQLIENTLIVFTSDNGPWIMMGKDGGSSGAFRNGKGTTFEGGIRVPLLAQYSGTIPAGTTIETPASMLDWFPTLNTLTESEIPTNIEIDGKDITRLLKGSTSQPDKRVLAFFSHGKIEAIRKGKWKLKRPYDSKTIPLPGVIKFFLKGEAGLASHDTMLFNLEDDPAEEKNLAASHPEILEEMQASLESFEAKFGNTPPSITNAELAMSPAIKIIMGAAAKFALIILSLLLPNL